MIPELGLICLIFALLFSLITTFTPCFPKKLSNTSSQTWVNAQTFFIVLAYGLLTYLFFVTDFTVRYVAENASKLLPWYYRLTAVWGAHEGSILLWITIYSLWIQCFNRYARTWKNEDKSAILAVLSFIQSGLLTFVIATSNPFQRYFETALKDGQDLNPLLQDPGFLIHPPILYTGYVGFAIAFAVSFVGLARKNFDWRWAAALRSWVQCAWLFLTLGIALGSWWAYRELGWGGFWFWDPVENASFMPWLSGTALLHTLIMNEKRKQFYSWSILLALITFSLSLLGTFLVRSGVLISVHAFASDPARGIYILAFLSMVVLSSLTLFACKADQLTTPRLFKPYSKETFLLLNSLILFVLMGTVLLGTLYPLLMQVLNIAKLSVGPPYFNSIFSPLSLPTLGLMAMSCWINWQSDHWQHTWSCLRVPLIVSSIFTVSLYFFIHRQYLNTYAAVGLSVLLILSHLKNTYQTKPGFRQNVLPMVLAHIGVAITVIGISLNVTLSQSAELAMTINDVTTLKNYQIHFSSIKTKKASNYDILQGQFELKQNKKYITTLQPERRYYAARRQVMTDAAIHTTLFRDIYVVLGERLPNGQYGVRIYEKPFIRWIWFGSILMALGILIGLMKKRRHYAF